MCPLRDHAPGVNLVSDRVFVTGFGGALKPYDGLVDPIVVTRRIGLGLLTTDRSLDQTLFAPIHHVTDHLASPFRTAKQGRDPDLPEQHP
jgi:hypothetical protein